MLYYGIINMQFVYYIIKIYRYDVLYNGNQKLSTKLLLGLSLDVANAFLYMHSFSPKIIHRDLKTRNVLINDDWIAKICDFGLCDNKNALVGTPCYMAPELLNEQSFNYKVDVYSYGLFLWELFAKEIPYEGIDPKRIKELLNDNIHPDIKKARSCPSEVCSLIQRV